MASVFEVAKYILEQNGSMSAMKLEKLVYYSQAWHMVWEENALFSEHIESWANGPVIPTLYGKHRGQFIVDISLFNDDTLEELSEAEKESINIVLETYGERNAQWLSDLTHKEAPWMLARKRAGVSDGERCSEVIRLADIHEYYSGLSDSK